MNSEGNILSFKADLFEIGPSLTFGVTAVAGQVSTQICHYSGGTAGIASGNSIAIQACFHLIPGQVLDLGDVRGTFYISTAGVTSVIRVLRGKTAGQ